MSNIPLQSIAFNSLPNTYTLPSESSLLPTDVYMVRGLLSTSAQLAITTTPYSRQVIFMAGGSVRVNRTIYVATQQDGSVYFTDSNSLPTYFEITTDTNKLIFKNMSGWAAEFLIVSFHGTKPVIGEAEAI